MLQVVSAPRMAQLCMKVLPKADVSGSGRLQQHSTAVKYHFMKLFSIKSRLQNAMRVLAQLYPYR